MNKWINAEWLEKVYEVAPERKNNKGCMIPISFILESIQKAPSIDIVFCGECMHRNNREKCPMRVFTGDNGYCSCGERSRQ